jgi:hypothetical protein
MFTTLLEDSTDTLYDSGIQTIRTLPLDYPSPITMIYANTRTEHYRSYDTRLIPVMVNQDGKIYIKKSIREIGKM